MKNDIQVGSTVFKIKGAKRAPLKVVARDATHAKIQYLSSSGEYASPNYARWYPLKDLALYLLPVPDETKKESKHFVISVGERDIHVQAFDLELGDHVLVETESKLEFGIVTGIQLRPAESSTSPKIMKIFTTEVKLDES